MHELIQEFIKTVWSCDQKKSIHLYFPKLIWITLQTHRWVWQIVSQKR